MLSVAHQAAGLDILAQRIDRGHRGAPPARQIGRARLEERIGADEERVGPLARKVAKAASISPLVLALRSRSAARGSAPLPAPLVNMVSVVRSIGRIDEHGNRAACGTKLVQQPQPLCHQLSVEKIDAGGVAARPGEARDQAKLDRVVADAEDDRDRRGCGLGRQRRAGCRPRRSRPPGGEPDRPPAPAADRIALSPAVFDRRRSGPRRSRFIQALAERGHIARVGIGRRRARRKPITGIAGCCARAASGHAPPRRRAA